MSLARIVVVGDGGLFLHSHSQRDNTHHSLPCLHAHTHPQAPGKVHSFCALCRTSSSRSFVPPHSLLIHQSPFFFPPFQCPPHSHTCFFPCTPAPLQNNTQTPKQYDPTVESSYRKLVTDPAGAFPPTMVEILDTAGQEDFSVLREQQLRGGDGFVLVYSVTSPQSFRAVRDFHDQALHHAGPDSAFVVAATKSDLDDERAITADEGREVARAIGAAFFETSARTNDGVAAPFVELTRRIRERRGFSGSTSSSEGSSPAPDDAAKSATPRARRGCTLL